MIFYVSDTLGSKRNGGVSMSGVDFLQLLRLHYDGVSVITSAGVPDQVSRAGNFADGRPLHPIGAVRRLARAYIPRRSLRSLARFVLVQFENLGRTRKIRLDTLADDSYPNLIFVNSWSDLYRSSRILTDSRFRTACIVRGNPESFVWQTNSADKPSAVQQAAAYLRQFDILIFVSSIGRDRWRPYLDDTTRSYYLPNSIDETAVAELVSQDPKALSAELGLPQDRANLVAVGSVQRRKGQDMLMETARTLRAKGHDAFQIHLVGVVSHTWGGKEIVNRIEGSDVAGHFTFYGHRDDALRFSRAADICIFPSRAEAFPRTVAEYMALSKPIVSTNVSGVPEMITDGENGLLCGIDEGAVMGEKVARLLADPELATQYGARARKTYETTFSKASQAERALEIFADIDGQHGA